MPKNGPYIWREVNDFRKMKSILTFSKWTKINVQKWLAEKVLNKCNYDVNKNSIDKTDDKNDKLLEYLMKENKEIKDMILEIVKGK